jgi:hypothetical protein
MELRDIKNWLPQNFAEHPELFDEDVSYFVNQLSEIIDHVVDDCVRTIWLSNPELADTLAAVNQMTAGTEFVDRLTEAFLPFVCLDQTEMRVSLGEIREGAKRRLLESPGFPEERRAKWSLE